MKNPTPHKPDSFPVVGVSRNMDYREVHVTFLIAVPLGLKPWERLEYCDKLHKEFLGNNIQVEVIS